MISRPQLSAMGSRGSKIFQNNQFHKNYENFINSPKQGRINCWSSSVAFRNKGAFGRSIQIVKNILIHVILTHEKFSPGPKPLQFESNVSQGYLERLNLVL